MNALHPFISSPKRILKNFRLIILLPAFLMLNHSLMGQIPSIFPLPVDVQEVICLPSIISYSNTTGTTPCLNENNYKVVYPNYPENISAYSIPIVSKFGNKFMIRDAELEEIEEKFTGDYACLASNWEPMFDEHLPAAYRVDIYVCSGINIYGMGEYIFLGSHLTDPSNPTYHSLDTYLNNPILDDISCIDNVSLVVQRITPVDNTAPYFITFVDAEIANDTCVVGGSIQFGALDSYVDLNGVICDNAPAFELGLKNLYTADDQTNNPGIEGSCFLGQASSIKWYYQNLGDSETEIEVGAFGDFFLDPKDLNIGTQKIKCQVTPPNYGGPGCKQITITRSIQVTEDPIVEFQATRATVVAPINHVFSLKDTLTSNSTKNGTPEVKWVTCPQDTCSDGFISMAAAGTFAVPYEGLFVFKYTANDPGNCVDPNPFATLPVYFVRGPSVDCTVEGIQTCNTEPFDIEITLDSLSPGANYTAKVKTHKKDDNGVIQQIGPTMIKDFNGSQTVNFTMGTTQVPPALKEYTYEVEVIGTIPAPPSDEQFYVDSEGNKVNTVSTYGPFGVHSTTLEDSNIQTFTSFNDGKDCGCEINDYPFSVCDISTNDYFNISCSFFSLDLFRVLGPNSLVAKNQHVDCSEPTVTLDSYNTQFLYMDPSNGVGGKKIEQLPGADIICDVFAFCICVDWLGIHIRPFHDLYEALQCDKTVSEVVFDMLSKVLDGDGGGGQVVADTNGDGTFDYLVAEGKMPLKSDSPHLIPQRVGSNGVLTVRMVEGWPNTTTGSCGDVTVPGMELFDLLPIGAIPVVGIIIEEILEAAGCGSNLSWSTYEDLKYYVTNENPPI